MATIPSPPFAGTEIKAAFDAQEADLTAHTALTDGVHGISAFGATLVDDVNAATARATLNVDPAGTDNSTDVTLAGIYDYLSLSGQQITLGQIDLTTDVTGVLPVANYATGTPDGTKFVRDDGTLQSIPGGGDALTSNPLSQFAATTSAQLRSVLSDETGTGLAYFQGGALGTPASGTLTSCTGLPISTGVAGLATNVATFLATPSSANLRAAVTDESGTGSLLFQGGALGTPTSGTLTNCTGLPISTGVTGLGTGVATFLATPSSANLAAAVTGETGSGALVFATSPSLVTPILGTPTSGNLTNCTGYAFANIASKPTTLSGYGITDAPKSDPTGVTGADKVNNMMSLTQAEYTAATKDASTVYFITDAV